MTTLTIRRISDETHRALRLRAARHGRSMEAEMREILESAVRPVGRVQLGSLLLAIGRRARLSDEEFAVFEQARSLAPAAGEAVSNPLQP